MSVVFLIKKFLPVSISGERQLSFLCMGVFLSKLARLVVGIDLLAFSFSSNIAIRYLAAFSQFLQCTLGLVLIMMNHTLEFWQYNLDADIGSI